METESILQRAAILFNQGRYQDAAEEAKKALSFQPDHPEALNILAQCHLQAEEPEEAEKVIDTALQIDPTDTTALYLKAAILFQRNKHTKAIKFIDSALSYYPMSADCYGLKAAIFHDLAKFEDALAAANKGLEFDASHLQCLNQRAQALNKLGDAEASQETLKDALSEDPENAFTHTNIGFALLENGQHQEAMKYFREALRLDPNSEMARGGMLHAIKASNLFYRWWLKYVFWLSKMSPKMRIFVIFGGFLMYKFIGSIKASLGVFEPLATLFIWTYLVIAISTWIIQPVSNLFLRFHPFGKFVLSEEEKKYSRYTLVTACLSLVGVALMLSMGTESVESIQWWNMGLYCTCYGVIFMIVSSAVGSVASKKGKRNVKLAGFLFIGWACMVLFLGIFLPVLALKMFNYSAWGFLGFQFYANSQH
ncbi:tetratricopeptide repeat protein [Rapidithrix thailandica]|uniref:Tetratricopeptide repeat protein n=1 Tax=Rapidithrix thailandica TaxID=413964 RepID=A0AAW9RZM7_9BACT